MVVGSGHSVPFLVSSRGVGEQKRGCHWGMGEQLPQNPVYPHLFPRFDVQVNVVLCTPLQRKTLIYQ